MGSNTYHLGVALARALVLVGVPLARELVLVLLHLPLLLRPGCSDTNRHQPQHAVSSFRAEAEALFLLMKVRFRVALMDTATLFALRSISSHLTECVQLCVRHRTPPALVRLAHLLVAHPLGVGCVLRRDIAAQAALLKKHKGLRNQF